MVIGESGVIMVLVQKHVVEVNKQENVPVIILRLRMVEVNVLVKLKNKETATCNLVKVRSYWM